MQRVTVDRVMADQRAASFTRRSIKKSAKVAGLRLALSMLDLTTLEGKDSPEKVRALCRKAVRPDPSDPSLPSCAAVCVYPSMVETAAAELRRAGVYGRALSEGGVRVASVATGFPSGQYPIDVKIEDTKRAIGAGADEIDMVIARGAFLAGEFERVRDEIAEVKEVCRGRARLKVILETGELETYDMVRAASDLALSARLEEGDFIKTSTGKVQPAATMGVTLVMLEAIRDHFLRTGVRIGMKPAGGIRTAKQALHYLVMVKETLGDDWLDPRLFRFGASTLTNDILMQLAKERSGKYAAGYDFSEA